VNPLLIGAVLGGLGVAAGAFGAHALKARVEPHLLAVFETGVRYQLVHALALLAVGLTVRVGLPAAARATPWFVTGVVLFSGSLYALALGAPSRLGLITPLGGTALLVGWVLFALALRGA